jgi:hypothetical protein
MRNVVVSASRGVYCGAGYWSDRPPTAVHQIKFPVWSDGRVALVMQDLKEIHGLADLRAVQVEGPDGARQVKYAALVDAGLFRIVEVET